MEREAMYVVSLFILWGSVRASAMPMAGDGRYPSTGIYNAKSVLQYRYVGTGVLSCWYWSTDTKVLACARVFLPLLSSSQIIAVRETGKSCWVIGTCVVRNLECAGCWRTDPSALWAPPLT